MKKKSLEDKIIVAVVGLLIFLFIFLIISYGLKIGFCKDFSGNSFYEILKDGLTLTAYYLAPILAYVLFSNWREEYVETKNANFSENIYKFITEKNSQIDTFAKVLIQPDDKLPTDFKREIEQVKADILKEYIIVQAYLSNPEIEKYNKTITDAITHMLAFIKKSLELCDIKAEHLDKGNTISEDLKLKLITSQREYSQAFIERNNEYLKISQEILKMVHETKVRD